MPLTDVEVLDGEIEFTGKFIILPLDLMRKADEADELLDMIRMAANGLDLSGRNIVVIEEDPNGGT